MFPYAHVKWFYGQSERAYYLNYFIIVCIAHLFRSRNVSWRLLACPIRMKRHPLFDIYDTYKKKDLAI